MTWLSIAAIAWAVLTAITAAPKAGPRTQQGYDKTITVVFCLAFAYVVLCLENGWFK